MIKFWKTRDPYGQFSNFYSCRFFLDNEWWSTSEHYYQSQKAVDEKTRLLIKNAKTAKEAKKIACQSEIKPNWDEIKYDVMKKALMAKFQQNKSFANLLISTGQEIIEEDSPYDSIWGIGKDGKGQNLLGKVLMEVREYLINNGYNKNPNQK